jgi:transposase-like protein
MKDLGTMNSWSTEPKAYVDHLATCGEDYAYKHFLGTPGKFVIRTQKQYNVVRMNLGNCYNQYTCKDCGIVYKVDSSD